MKLKEKNIDSDNFGFHSHVHVTFHVFLFPRNYIRCLGWANWRTWEMMIITNTPYSPNPRKEKGTKSKQKGWGLLRMIWFLSITQKGLNPFCDIDKNFYPFHQKVGNSFSPKCPTNGLNCWFKRKELPSNFAWQ